MKYFRHWLLMLVLTAVVVVVATCKEKVQQKPHDSQEPPLLLEDSNDAEDFPTGPVADNSRCHVCHINYEVEELAVVHAQANISCEQCHGASDAHCSDEDNITPAEIMYPAAKINPSCMECHPRENIDIQPHEPLLAGIDSEKKYCTDCHGDHRLSYRTRKWDKATGELIEDDKVRMMTDEMLEQK